MLACALKIWQVKAILPIGSPFHETGIVGCGFESTGTGEDAESVASRSGVGVEAGKLQEEKNIMKKINTSLALIQIKFLS